MGKTMKFQAIILVMVVVVMVAAMVETVECNYSIASGGGRVATNKMEGNHEAADEGSSQVGKEVFEEAGGGGSWIQWAKDKIQSGLGLKHDEHKEQGVEEVNDKIHQVINGIVFTCLV